MSYLKQYQVDELLEKIIDDKSKLGKIFKARNSEYQYLSVDHSLLENYLKEGWETYSKPLKTKTRIRKRKNVAKQFEDDIWCQLYKLGYRKLNYDSNFILPFSKNDTDKKQIDVIAINEDSIIIVECKSSAKPRKAPSYKDEFELLNFRLDGFRKALWQMFGREKKIKYIFATRNIRMNSDSKDLERIRKARAFYYNDNTFDYINNLIKTYKKASLFQFLGLIFKNEEINNQRISIPAVKGKMGNLDYYMFSIEPSLLLKMGFVLHRTKANESEFPTYQRLLVPNRLKSISKFIEAGGFFPNSIILNFNLRKNKFVFEDEPKSTFCNSCTGVLKIPNAYGIAYIIDGQHRIYGYANTKFLNNNTIPVVAFHNLDTITQLEMFMDINQNQKAVSPSLKLDLEEDLYWDSDRVDSRLKALRSSIIKVLAYSSASPLNNRISVGEDRALLSFKPFATAIANSDLLPKAKGNKYNEDSIVACIYDINNQNHNIAMINSKKQISEFIIKCYEFVENDYPHIFNRDKYFIVSNRGTFAFISLIGSLNKHETLNGNLSQASTIQYRFNSIVKYLKVLFNYISNSSSSESERYLSMLGSSADVKWLRYFQTIINNQFPDYNPPELIDWKERQDAELQDKGRKLGVEIEKYMKHMVIKTMKVLFEDNWELEVNSIKRECMKRAEEEKERNYKEGLEVKDIAWTEMFNINDYKSIILKYFTKKPEDYKRRTVADFKTFSDTFSIDIGEGLGSKSKRVKWISRFNSYRNLWAHEGTKEKRLNKNEVSFLQFIYDHFFNKPN